MRMTASIPDPPPLNGPRLSTVEEAIAADEYHVDLVNAFFSPSELEWRAHRAAKSHVDLFGDIIEKNEPYYTRYVGGSDRDKTNPKLSIRSMDKVLRVVFQGNPAGISVARHFIKKKDDAWEDLLTRSPRVLG